MVERRAGADTRMTLRQAAAALGVSESAIRKRINRGTLRTDKGPDGRRYVYLGVAEPGADTVAEEGVDTSAIRERDALISSKDETIAVLREQLEAQLRANEENRRVILALTSRIPQLEAPPEPPEAPEAVDEVSESAEPRSDAAGPQTATQPSQGGGPLLGSDRDGYTSRQQERIDERVLRAFRELADRDPNMPIAVHEVREIADVPGLSDELDRLQHKGYIAQLPDKPNLFAVTDEGHQVASDSEPRGWWRRVFGG